MVGLPRSYQRPGFSLPLRAPYHGPMTTVSTSPLELHLELLPPPDAPPKQAPQPLEGAQVLLVHGLASTPQLNWHRTRWVSTFQAQGATLHTVTLPYHQVPTPVENSCSTVNLHISDSPQGILRPAAQALQSYLTALTGDLHLVGYSLGARLCWMLAALYPEAISSLTLGAMPLTHHLPLVNKTLRFGSPPPEGFADILAGSPLPKSQLQAFTALPIEPFSPSPRPACPILFFRGTQDTVATDSLDAYRLLPSGQATWLEYPRRDHISILTSGKLRAAVTEFMVRHR